MLAGKSTNSLQQPGPFSLLSRSGPQYGARVVGKQSGPLGQLLAHPIWWREMLNSPRD